MQRHYVSEKLFLSCFCRSVRGTSPMPTKTWLRWTRSR